MVSRRKVILALGVLMVPGAAAAATTTVETPTPDTAKPLASVPPAKTPPAKTPPAKTPPVKTPPAKTAPAKTPPAKKPDPKKEAVRKPDPKKKPPVQKKSKPAPRLIITINKASQSMSVNLDGDTLYRWKVSTGARGYDTPSGNFRPFRMEKEHFSKEWDDAPMPYSIFFTGRGHAVHGSYHVKSLGRRASHGCVRLHPDNAAKLFALVRKTGMSNTRVIVKGGFFSTADDFTEKLKAEKKRFDKAGSFLDSILD